MENYDVKKIANFISFFIENDVKYLGITKLMKLFFFADKYHLEAYGKPILNYGYTKLQNGPVPMYIHSLIKSSETNNNDDDLASEVQEFNKLIKVKVKQSEEISRFENLAHFDKKFFSKSHMIILNRLVVEFKDMRKSEISDLSHETLAWRAVNLHESISFSSMIENNPELSKYVRDNEIEKIQFNSNVQRVIGQARAK